MGSNERGSEDGGGGEGDESRSQGEEERQQVVVGCSTDSVSHGLLLTPYFRRCLFRAQVSLQGCPSSCVPWCVVQALSLLFLSVSQSCTRGGSSC